MTISRSWPSRSISATSPQAPVTRQVIVAYDEIAAIKYFGEKLLPYWKRNGATATEMLAKAARDYPKLADRCAKFDEELDGRRDEGGRRKIRADVSRWPTANASPPAVWRPTPTSSRYSSPRKTPATATSPRWTCFSRWTRSGSCSVPTLAKATLVPILELRGFVALEISQCAA